MTLPVPLADFETFLHNPDVDAARAQMILDLAHQLCQSIVTPLPTGAEAVVLDVAGRAYAIPPEGVGPYATIPASSGMPAGGLYLTRENKATLRRLHGGGGAFTIDTAPATAPTLPWWDTGTSFIGDWDIPS